LFCIGRNCHALPFTNFNPGPKNRDLLKMVASRSLHETNRWRSPPWLLTWRGRGCCTSQGRCSCIHPFWEELIANMVGVMSIFFQILSFRSFQMDPKITDKRDFWPRGSCWRKEKTRLFNPSTSSIQWETKVQCA